MNRTEPIEALIFETSTTHYKRNNISETEYIFFFRQKAYEFMIDAQYVLNKYPKAERYAMESYIKNTIYSMYEEIIKFQKSGSISRLYEVDSKIAFLKDMFKFSREIHITCVTPHRLTNLCNTLDELGRICGGLIAWKLSRKRNK